MIITRKSSVGLSTVFLGACVVLLLLAICPTATAVTFEGAKRIHITNLHHLDDDLYAMGGTITIDGQIDGDLFAFGEEVTSHGSTTGSQSIAAERFEHAGRVIGAVRFFGYRATIEGFVGRSFLGMGNTIVMKQGSMVQKDVTIFASDARLEGTIAGDLEFRGNSISLSGTIGGNADIEAESISIIPPAIVSGDFKYISEREIDFDTLPGITVIGEINWKKPQITIVSDNSSEPAKSILNASRLFAAFLFGILMLVLFRKYIDESFNQVRSRFPVTVATGVLGLIIFIASVFLLLISLIFFLIGYMNLDGDMAFLSAILLMLSTLSLPIFSFVSLSGGILFYAGKIILAGVIGHFIIRLFKRQAKILSKTQLFLGLLILAILFSLPYYIGLILYLTAGIIGAGAIILGIRHCDRKILNNIAAENSSDDSGGTVTNEPAQ